MDNTASRFVTLTPLNANLPALTFAMGGSGDAKYAPSSSGGAGGWQVVDRPKRVAATQWFDRAPWSLTLDLIINRSITDGKQNFDPTVPLINIENDCALIESFMDAIPNTLEPPLFSVSGPVPGIKHIWCIYGLDFQEALRHPTQGWRYQQNLNIVLYEYTPPNGAISLTAPSGYVETFNYNVYNGTSSFKTVTVGADPKGNPKTLISIANGDANLANLIQKINNIRDPSTLVIGQTLLIPHV